MSCVLALLALSGVAAPAVYAAGFEGSGALNQLSEGAQETTTTQAATTSKTSEATNSQSVILLATGGAIVLLCAIGFVIARDARRVAPADDDDLAEYRDEHALQVKMRKRRAKAKAARKQRKRTRAR